MSVFRGFRSRAVKSSGNIEFPNPVYTKTENKNVIPREISGRARTHSYACLRGGMTSDRSGVSSVLRIFYRFCSVGARIVRMLHFDSRRCALCILGVCVGGFLPKQSKLLGAPVASSRLFAVDVWDPEECTSK